MHKVFPNKCTSFTQLLAYNNLFIVYSNEILVLVLNHCKVHLCYNLYQIHFMRFNDGTFIYLKFDFKTT